MIAGRVFYDKFTGEALLYYTNDNGISWPVSYDLERSQTLADRVPSTVGVIEIEYGQYAQDFASCIGWRVDVSGDEPVLVFSYPDPNDSVKPPVYQPPLSEVVTTLEEENALLTLELAQTQLRLEQEEQEQASLLLELVSKEVL